MARRTPPTRSSPSLDFSPAGLAAFAAECGISPARFAAIRAEVAVHPLRREAIGRARELATQVSDVLRLLESPDLTDEDVRPAIECIERVAAVGSGSDPNTVRLIRLVYAVDAASRIDAAFTAIGRPVSARFLLAYFGQSIDLFSATKLDEASARAALEAWTEERPGRRGRDSKWQAIATAAAMVGIDAPKPAAIKRLWLRRGKPDLEQLRRTSKR